MGGSVIALDNIVSATFFFASKWTPALKRSQARDLLRLLVCKLYGVSRGYVFHAHMRASQASLAADLGISREWCNRLVGRLVEAGWLRYSAPRLPDGTFEVGTFRPGRMLKRLLCVLLGYRRHHPHRVKDPSQKLPTPKQVEENKRFFSQLLSDLSAKLATKCQR
ncbi:MAG TPA: helix-turn-helix domain-containing protein [Candidatus Binatia bacterium]|jgi:DNA-binding Lrp family transcriptional regulator|nr:helix-turn-helix domain-containing protein [Candidatus Binatia bacterium]